jgi:hypothetical protein
MGEFVKLKHHYMHHALPHKLTSAIRSFRIDEAFDSLFRLLSAKLKTFDELNLLLHSSLLNKWQSNPIICFPV